MHPFIWIIALVVVMTAVLFVAVTGVDWFIGLENSFGEKLAFAAGCSLVAAAVGVGMINHNGKVVTALVEEWKTEPNASLQIKGDWVTLVFPDKTVADSKGAEHTISREEQLTLEQAKGYGIIVNQKTAIPSKIPKPTPLILASLGIICFGTSQIRRLLPDSDGYN